VPDVLFVMAGHVAMQPPAPSSRPAFVLDLSCVSEKRAAESDPFLQKFAPKRDSSGMKDNCGQRDVLDWDGLSRRMDISEETLQSLGSTPKSVQEHVQFAHASATPYGHGSAFGRKYNRSRAVRMTVAR
jgi:hypothetical protein